MISILIATYGQAGADIGELPALCLLILSAGWLTTTNLICNCVDALQRQPDLWHKLKTNPALIGTAVEEITRLDMAVPFIFRIAREDLTSWRTSAHHDDASAHSTTMTLSGYNMRKRD
jgi:cytochrome P450